MTQQIDYKKPYKTFVGSLTSCLREAYSLRESGLIEVIEPLKTSKGIWIIHCYKKGDTSLK